MRQNNEQLGAKGPWVFELPELQPGETFTKKLRNAEYNGQKGWFKKYLPIETAQVTNLDDTSPIRVVFNGTYPDDIPPNVSETYEQIGVASFEVTNRSDSAVISADDVTVTLLKEAYGADEAARQSAQKGVVQKVSENLFGVGPGDL